MAIIGADDRTTVTSPAGSNLNAAAVDVPNTSGTNPGYSSFGNLPGSGYAISSNFFLTAGHVINGNSAARITMAADVGSLPARGLSSSNAPSSTGANSLNVDNITNFSTDIALVQTSSDLASDGSVLGLVVFYDHNDLRGLQMETAGFPIQGVPLIDGTGRTFMESSSAITTTTEGRVSYTADTQGGQSGSGVWLDAEGYAAGSNLQIAGGLDLFVGTHVSGSSTKNNATRITPEIYKTITDTMETAAGEGAASEAAVLPVNVIVGGFNGSGSVGNFVPGDNFIDGSYRREHIFGDSGNDRIEAGGADDNIDGGLGVDQVLYEGALTDYTITIVNGVDPDNPGVQISHSKGSKRDGVDTIRNTEFAVFQFLDSDAPAAAGYGVDDDGVEMFVPLLADQDDPTKLRDGTQINVSQKLIDSQGDSLGSFSVELPAFMFDGDIDYTLTFGAEANFQYNFAYIVDVSGSMTGNNLTETKAAYIALTNDLIAQGVASQSQFAVIPFSSSASLRSGLDALGAISEISGLNAGGGTDFSPPLATAEGWFESLANVGTATNIAYFLSDGQGGGASPSLQDVLEGTSSEAIVDVRAFGIGSGADLNSLNQIDSGSAVLLTNPEDLKDAFSVSGIERAIIDRIEVKLDGKIVESIDPSTLIDGALGLTYQGSVSGLSRSIAANNIVTFDVVFNDGSPTASIQSRVTTGQTELRQVSSDGTQEYVSLAVNSANYIIQGESEIVSANQFDNEIKITDGFHVVQGFGGNDRFIVEGGKSAIDGGDGIDTVVYSKSLSEIGGITQTGGVITIGTGDTLTNVEFAEFSDTRIILADLSEAPILSIDRDEVTVSESSLGSAKTGFQFSLSSVTSQDVTIAFATRDGSATAGEDFNGKAGRFKILAGESSKTLSLKIFDDMVAEGVEDLSIDFNIVEGPATFEAGAKTTSGRVVIEDNDTFFEAILVNDDPRTSEGTGGDNDFAVKIRREGQLSEPAKVNYVVVADSAKASDFVGGLPSGSVTFESGEDEVSILLPIYTDSIVENDESFTLDLTLVEGNGVFEDSLNLTILDDDGLEPSGPSRGNDILRGTPGSDVIYALSGNDEVYGLSGFDFLNGGKGNDKIKGGKGNDLIFGNSGTDLLIGDAGNDSLQGNSGRDSLKGGKGIDNLFGGGGNDKLKGGAGADELFGDNGKDFLDGGKGNDVLTGGAKADVFFFKKGSGKDVIADFQIGVDTVEIGKGAKRFGQLTFEEAGADVVMTFRNVQVTFQDTLLDEVASRDYFVF